MKTLGLLTLFTLIFSGSNVFAQEKKIEIGMKVAGQSPNFWNGSFLDITTPKDSRIRPAFGIYTKYHLSKKIFAEYDIDLSLEGGGFEKRITNLTFLKNTLFLGISTNTYKNNSFNFKIGTTLNSLLRAKMNDEHTNELSDVSKYFRTSSTSIPFSVGYVRRINENYTLGLNTYFQIFSGPLNSQGHISYAQTLQRFEIKVSKFIMNKNH